MINNVINESAQGLQQIAVASNDLMQLSQNLKTRVEFFQIEGKHNSINNTRNGLLKG